MHEYAVAAGHVGVVRDRGADRGEPGLAEPAAELAVERPDDGGDRVGFEAGRRRVKLGDPHGRNLLDLNILCWHGALHLDDPEPRLDLGQPGAVGGDLRLQLSSAQPQHPVQHVDAELLLHHHAHLIQGEAEVLQRDDPVESGELAGRVEAVAAGWVDIGQGRSSPVAS